MRPDPVLPHPRTHLRGFVLLPLRDIAPVWVHPRLELTLQDLIETAGPQEVHALI